MVMTRKAEIGRSVQLGKALGGKVERPHALSLSLFLRSEVPCALAFLHVKGSVVPALRYDSCSKYSLSRKQGDGRFSGEVARTETD